MTALERFMRGGVRPGHVAMFELWNEERLVFTLATLLPAAGRASLFALDVTPFVFSDAIVLTPLALDLRPSDFYVHRWCFQPGRQAFEAAWQWLASDELEPTGWHRHIPSGRRRPGGDPEREFVAP